MAEGSSTINLLGMARTALSASNHAEALSYYNRVLEIDPTIAEAWEGKGKSAGWQSTLANLRLSEVVIAFQHALANASSDETFALSQRLSDEANQMAAAIYNLSRNHLTQYVTVNSSWSDHVARTGQLIDMLQEAQRWSPDNQLTLNNTIKMCKETIEGVSYRDPYQQNLPKAWTLTPQYETVLRGIMDDAAQKLKSLQADYSPPVIQKKTADACFVVTATMGDENHPHVVIMKRLRDEWLRNFSWGRSVILAYQQIGPAAARFIAARSFARKLSFLLIVAPGAWIARRIVPAAGK